MIDFTDKTFLVAGIANKKSVAFHIAKLIISVGGKVIATAQHQQAKEKIQVLLPDTQCFICNVENKLDIEGLPLKIKESTNTLDGFVHSLAFADFSNPVSFHATRREHFLQATQISAFSFVEMTNALLPILNDDSSVITISISNTKATSYGYMGPIKAMLEHNVCYLAKSLSETTKIRVNSVGSGPLKTSASAGIPNYIENYLFTEKLTLRKENLKTIEVAQTATFLLSKLSSGINAQNIIVDAGMSSNYFDQDIVKSLSL